MCQKSEGQTEVCVTPELPQEWLATLIFMILGVVALTLTCCLLVVSPWKPSIVDTAKWIVFIGSKSAATNGVYLVYFTLITFNTCFCSMSKSLIKQETECFLLFK